MVLCVSPLTYFTCLAPSRAQILRRLYAKEIENELGLGGLHNQNQQLEPATSAALFVSTAIDLEAQGYCLPVEQPSANSNLDLIQVSAEGESLTGQ